MNPTFIVDDIPEPYNDYGLKPYVPFGISNITIGPIGINDPSKELNNRFWATYFNPSTNDIELEDIENEITTIIINEPDGVTNIGLAFDQNANDVYAWITGLGELKLRWFDASLPGDAVLSLGQAQSVTITMDTKYFPSSADSDILIFYIRDEAIYYRIQRDKYATEYATPVIENAKTLIDSGTRRDYRFQIRWTEIIPE
jgi:hypothetical protein